MIIKNSSSPGWLLLWAHSFSMAFSTGFWLLISSIETTLHSEAPLDTVPGGRQWANSERSPQHRRFVSLLYCHDLESGQYGKFRFLASGIGCRRFTLACADGVAGGMADLQNGLSKEQDLTTFGKLSNLSSCEIKI